MGLGAMVDILSFIKIGKDMEKFEGDTETARRKLFFLEKVG
jgi:hypothetical protein